MMISGVVLAGHFYIVLDVVVDLRHLDLIVHHIRREVPIGRHLLHPLCQFVELPQRLLSEIVEV